MARRVGAVLACLLVLLTGCITTEEAELFRSDIRKLKREIRRLRDEGGRRTKALQTAVDPVAARIQTLRKELEAVRRTQADFESRLTRTQREAAKATGIAEERDFRERKIEKGLRELKGGLEGRLAALEKELTLVKTNMGFKGPVAAPARPIEIRPAGPTTPTPKPTASSPIPPPTAALPPPPTATPPPAISADDRGHNAALALLKAGKWKEARKKFQDVLQRFPTSRLADDAQFWIGETYYKEKRYDKAILEFDKVVINYAKGNRVPSALLKQGFAFLALGDKASAKQLLTQLVKEYPDSEEATKAKSRLSSL